MGSHTGADDAETHVSSRLDDYLLGTLSAPEEFVVEDHLLACPQCRSESDEISSVAAAVATLPSAVVAAIEDATRSPAGPKPADRNSGVRAGIHRRGRAAMSHVRPADGRSADGPGARRASRRRLALRRTATFVAVLGLGAALGIGGWRVIVATGGFEGVSVGSSDTQDQIAGSLTITLAARAGGGIDVNAVAVGLRPGTDFELIAVANNSRNYVVARGVAVGGPQTIRGSIPIAADSVRFFALLQPNSQTLLVAHSP